MEPFTFTLAQRQHWMSVLAHSTPASLNDRMKALNLAVEYRVIRPPETGLIQLQGRMGATGDRFLAGDTTLTRAVIQLTSGTYGYSYILGRDKGHAECSALIDALLQEKTHHLNLMETLIGPLDAERTALRARRQRHISTSRVDFFTLVRGDNA